MGFILLIDGDLDTLSYPPGLDGLLKSSRGVITAKRSPVSMGSSGQSHLNGGEAVVVG